MYSDDAPPLRPELLELGIPVLGICYGMQAMALGLGGHVEGAEVAEFGRTELRVREPGRLLAGLPREQTCWMSHRDTVFEPPPGFAALASSPASPVAAFESVERGLYGIQFHPEVVHTPHGTDVLRTFLRDVCGCEQRVDARVGRRRAGRADPRAGRRGPRDLRPVGRRRLLGRGADRAPRARRPARPACWSTTACCARTRREQVVTHVPRPLRRAARARGRARALPRAARGRRRTRSTSGSIIGEEFIRVFEEEAAKLDDVGYLVQGTLYSDVIESGGGASGDAAKIKSHHNVGGLPEHFDFDLIEPLRQLFKDEVRAVGAELGLPERLVWRQPFPGPGLAIRVIGGEVTRGAARHPARRRRDPAGGDPRGRPLPRAVAVVHACCPPCGRSACRATSAPMRTRS